MNPATNALNTLLCTGMFHAITAHKEVFKDEPYIPIVLGYLNSATSYFTAAESLYYSCNDIKEDNSLPEVFHCFKVFEEELLENIRTNHSHQWTDIEFQRLREAFMSSTFAFKDEELFS